MQVVGGTYLEFCREPPWEELFGSGLRAAAWLRAKSIDVKLKTFISAKERETLDAYATEFGLEVEAEKVPKTPAFYYVHGLSTPNIEPPLHLIGQCPPVRVEADTLLRFGFLEGDGIVKGGRVVYDPQSTYSPKSFSENGSEANNLAVVTNVGEARRLTGTSGSLVELAEALRLREKASVAIVKAGAFGAYVSTDRGVVVVPPLKTDFIFPVGSGDIFSAEFAYQWAERGLDPVDSARLASAAVAAYCNSRGQLIRSKNYNLGTSSLLPLQLAGDPGDKQIYLAGPFFTIEQRWLADEARSALLGMGVKVFSPFHDVGFGPAKDIAVKDLKALKSCHSMLAILSGLDAGTLFEVGYACAVGLPVVALAQNTPRDHLKMVEGSNCAIVDDFVSAVYRSVWAALEAPASR